MKNKRVLTYFISILGASLLFFGLAAAGSYAADQFLNGKRFGDHTYAGPFDLSNRTSGEAEVKLTSDLLGMQDKLQADLVYQDAKIPLPAELVTFSAAETVERAETEAENPLVATVNEDGLRTLLQQELPMLTLNDSEVTAVAQGIGQKLETGILPQTVRLTDYLGSAQPTAVIAEAEIAVDGFSPPMMDVLETLDGTALEPDVPFSLLQFAEAAEPGLLADEELTVLASALYEAALHTDFLTEERSIRTELLGGIKPGFEAAINRQLGLDFSLTNPNQTSYTIRSHWQDGSLRVAFEGLPLRYAYEPYVAGTDTYKQKTTVHYNPDLAEGRVILSEQGKEGMEVTVQRKVLEDGSVLTVEAVSEDFYPPIPRVEERALPRPEQNSGADGTGSPGSTPNESPSAGGGSSSNSGSPSGGSPTQDGTGSTQNGTGSTPNGGTDSRPSGNPDDQVGHIDGKPAAKPEDDGHIYDKSGNLIR